MIAKSLGLSGPTVMVVVVVAATSTTIKTSMAHTSKSVTDIINIPIVQAV